MAKRTPPNTIATLAGGNQPASLLDQNFAAPVYGDTAVTQWNVPLWGDTTGQYATTGLPTNPAHGTIDTVVGLASGKLPAVDGSQLTNLPAGVVQNYISGLTLSNDGGTPNTILDIATGTAADSTNAVMITLASAFTKTTGGSWTSGTGNAGMGVGLTIANSTTYHVFAIINSSAADVYFDTSASAANKPVGTTSFRRIGSFRTDGSAHIVAFSQNGNEFLLATPVLDINALSVPTTASTQTLASVPTGVKVNALIGVLLVASSGANCSVLISSLDTNDTAPSATGIGNNAGASTALSGAPNNVRTNTSAQFRIRASTNNLTAYITTLGWIDNRGMI